MRVWVVITTAVLAFLPNHQVASAANDSQIYNQALHADEAGRTDEAIRLYQKALKVNPKDAHAYNNLGILWSKKGQLKKAERAFASAIRLAPNDFSSSEGYANTLTREGRAAEAMSAYEKAGKLASTKEQKKALEDNVAQAKRMLHLK